MPERIEVTREPSARGLPMPLVGHAFAALAATLRKRLGAMVTLLGVAGLACGVQASNPLDPARAGQTGETSSASAAPVTQVAVPGKTTLPASMKIKYAVESNKFPFSATTDLLWRQNGETYEIQQESGTLGIAIQRSSRGHITPVGLAPLRFSYKILSELSAQVDREKNKVTFSANTPDAPLLAGAQDQLSIQVQLAAMLAGNPAHFSRGTALTIQVVGPRASDMWVIAVIGEEKLFMPGGELMAIKLVRNPKLEFDQKLELWMAPALGYLPARIRISEPNGDYVDQKWLATEPPP